MLSKLCIFGRSLKNSWVSIYIVYSSAGLLKGMYNVIHQINHYPADSIHMHACSLFC